MRIIVVAIEEGNGLTIIKSQPDKIKEDLVENI